ncbi:MAG: BON domain-containing protein [Chloroflexota bacterium]|jgi:osmotically-inducible protein OsmY
MGWIRVLFLAALGGFVARWAFRSHRSLPGPLAQKVAGLKCGLETAAIHKSADYLRSQGAEQTASQAEQEALTAHRVACMLADRLGAAADGITVMVIGRLIHLEGQIGSDAEKKEAEKVAMEASGAEVVADDLQVTR